MRIARLDLIRYGKFSDRQVDFPPARPGAPDFHVVVGANEAGKSTLRCALSDLLYGFPRSSPFAFAHKLSDLRLGAVLCHGEERLEFQRRKASTKTLRGPGDELLKDDALDGYLAGVPRDHFEKMFGLDRGRLLEGGASILAANSNLGQILFESAAGVANLSRVRSALDDAASSLWARRGSQDRAYYQAKDAYETAKKKLGEMTVRAKDWKERLTRLTDLETALDEAQTRHAELSRRRAVLERVRRVAPYFQALREHTAALETMAQVGLLPASAGETLARAETRMAAESARREAAEQAVKAEAQALEALVDDPDVRERAGAIGQLEELRVQYDAYDRDLPKREAEHRAAWDAACTCARELAWDTSSEEALSRCSPSALVVTRIRELQTSHGALQTDLRTKQEALDAQRDAEQRRTRELALLVTADVPASLTQALSAAQALGDTSLASRVRRVERDKRLAEQERSLSALGRFRVEVARLRAQLLPDADAIQGLMGDRKQAESDVRAADTALQARQREVAAKQLELVQQERSQVVVTRAQVLEARVERDARWGCLTAEPAALVALAPSYEQAVKQADQLADTREATLDAATQLLSRRNELERLHADRDAAVQEHARAVERRALSERRFQELVAEAGLAGMKVEEFAPWCNTRRDALSCAERVDEAARALRDCDGAALEAAESLAAALRDAGVAAEGTQALAALILSATQFVQRVEGLRTKLRTLEAEAGRDHQERSRKQRELTEAQERVEGWRAAWVSALEDARLPAHLSPRQVEDALALMQGVQKGLADMAALHTDRIVPMRRDLANFASRAQQLASVLLPEGVALAPAEITIRLSKRLSTAIEIHARRANHAQIRDKQRQLLAEAETQLTVLMAELQPLLRQAAVERVEDLRLAITASDRRRSLEEAVRKAEKELVLGGDGLSRSALQAELDAVDVTTAAEEVSGIDRALSALQTHQNQVSAERADAQRSLDAIGGADAAARAEAERQDALSRMAQAIEAYIPLATASLLLGWAIERHRETHQGPMLERASRIFARLTRGSFVRLEIDSEEEPPKLRGRREDGSHVDVSGMSEGARDQLYLALYLAALDLRLDASRALPFVADDLVVNFDDARAEAALTELTELSRKTQVVFLTHHHHLLPAVRRVVGEAVNVVEV